MEKYLKKISEIKKYVEFNDTKLALEEIDKLYEDILYNVALKNANSKNKIRLQCAKKILNDENTKNRPLFQKIYKINNEYMLCNGFVGVILKDKIEGLEVNENSENCLDLNKVIPLDLSTNYKEINFDKVEIEKSIIQNKSNKEDKEQIPLILKVNELEIGVNPTYLKYVIGILGNNVKMICSINNNRNPIYLESELGRAIIMPMDLDYHKK